MTMQQNPQRQTPPPGEQATTISPTRARAGETGHNVRYVLAASLAAIIVAFAVVYLTYFS